jgi:uncharacterized membrane protein YvlD (DUF360 family)
MNIEFFISVLVISATASSLAIEVVKKFLDKLEVNYKTMPVAVAIAFIIGVVEMLIYIPSVGDWVTVMVYSACSGIANVVGSTVGYDTVKALLLAMFSKPE